MNRSILIVICDFLLVSLLAFSTVDINEVADAGAPRQMTLDIATNRVDGGEDLNAVMRMALAEERKGRDQIMSELEKSRTALGERDRQMQNYRQELQTREEQARRLEHEQAALQNLYSAAQTNLQELTLQLQNTSTEAVVSREKYAALEAEMRKQTEQAAALQKELNDLARSNEVVLSEKQRLAGQLEVAEVEKRHAGEQIVAMREQVKAEREEKAKLAEGVKVLANRSTELVEEIRENRPLAPNTIFNEFVTNRVEARFTAIKSGLFGDNTRRKDTHTVLVFDGTRYYALCHVEGTPLSLANPGTDWDGLSGTLVRNASVVPIQSIFFGLRDPRLVWVPLSATEAKQLGGRIYRTSSDPYKFQDAVLIGTQEDYYGECRFEIDTSTPDYVRLDRGFLRGLFGKFNPSRGDLVFSKTGELLGVMANGSYCLMLRNFEAAATFRFGEDVRRQRTGAILSQLSKDVATLPAKLQ